MTIIDELDVLDPPKVKPTCVTTIERVDSIREATPIAELKKLQVRYGLRWLDWGQWPEEIVRGDPHSMITVRLKPEVFVMISLPADELEGLVNVIDTGGFLYLEHTKSKLRDAIRQAREEE